MDLLSDVFSRLRLRGDVYFTTDFSGRWGVQIPSDQRTIRFHLVIHGQCWVTVDGESEPTLLKEREFALIPHGAGQRLSSSPEGNTVALENLITTDNPDREGVLRYSTRGSGGRCRLVCGFCRFDGETSHPLFFGLPAMIHLNVGAVGKSPWLADAVRVTTLEANLGDPGMRSIISRLIEILFMQGVRTQTSPSADTGNPFMLAILDRQLHPALQAIHEQLDRDWTLSDLAGVARMSRTQFARRFKDVLQQTPIQYLTNWRLQSARQLLKESDLNVAEIAFRSGYQSLPSFSRRFKERFGVTPAAYRRQSDTAETTT